MDHSQVTKICAQAPHHSTASWAYFWGKEAAKADIILSTAQKKSKEALTTDCKDISKRSLSSSSIANDEEEYADDTSKGSASEAVEIIFITEAPGGDEAAMGQSTGDPYTDAGL